MLPKTSADHYITGKTALNIPLPEEGQGDWHFQEAFFGRGNVPPKIFLAGTGESWNTNSILGNFGIYNCETILRDLGIPIPTGEPVFAAGHYRAVLDLLYYALQKNTSFYHLELDAWFETQTQKNLLLDKARAMLPFLTPFQQKKLKQWILFQN